ncbi:hypothetical protein [Pediococcus ethanolidurans]|uniref:Uncharacterized protein n=1 Tax=Pediococcus ethanolidurans TaxID=319653 RepID=A0A0R2JY56_9LACO|nr:hypothetical protein [Pediococcus ethanolidurans]KRN82137.1 hypothetical protein IV87_GL000514 [Pediococcus ethanolidurans]GEN95494.1 hypothetical protein PET01_15440 [Pediococcus ethanolidurans]SER72357.1 hypothetical protein SAMN04487973_11419 [Pediococcus ethanolidurans]
MNYFFTKQIQDTNDYDFQLFQNLRKSQEIKFVTTDYDRFYTRKIQQLNISENEVINMFNSLQVKNKEESKAVHFMQLNLKSDQGPQKLSDGRLALYHEGYCYCIVSLFQETDLINQLTFYDQFQNVIEIDSYDVRGFLSLKTIYGQNGGVATDKMFTPNKKLVYEEFYQRIPNSQKIESTLSIIHAKNQISLFDSRTELIANFFHVLKAANTDKIYASQNFLNQYNFDNDINFVVAN